MTTEQYVGQVGQEQINAWKELHKDIFAIKAVDAEDTTHICYLRKPTRKHISAATVAGKVDPIKFNETLLRQCWLGGSDAIRTNDDMFMSAGGVLVDLVQVKEAELEKL